MKDILKILSLPRTESESTESSCLRIRLLRTIFVGILGPIGFCVTAVDPRHDFNILSNLINFKVLNFIFLAGLYRTF